MTSIRTPILWSAVVRYGLALSLAFTVVVLGTYWVDPRIWINDFPPEVQAAVGEVPAWTELAAMLVLLVILGLMIGVPVRMGRRLPRGGFGSLWLHAFLVMLMMNLWDLLVVDILVFNTLQPDFMLFKGMRQQILQTTTAAFHAEAFASAIPILAALALVSATIGRYAIKPTTARAR